MREVSDDFNRAVINGRFVARVDCTLAGGGTVTFLPQDIMQGGISVNSATSNSGSFGIGCAVIGRCTIRLRNERRQLNGMNLSGARVEPYIGAIVGGDGEQAEVEWMKLGTYWVEPFDIYDDIVSLTCLDALSKMEVPCSSTGSNVTLGDLAYELCNECGLTLMTETFPHSDYTITEMPDLSGKSCLEVLSYVAQMAGCYVTTDENGDVYLKWYSGVLIEGALDGGGFHFEVDSADGGGFHFDVDYYSGGLFLSPYEMVALKSFQTSVAPHTVTGLAVSDVDGTQHVAGSDGYVLHIKDNPLIESGRASEVAANVAPNVLNVSLRGVRVSMPGSPAMQAGDPITVVDRFGEHYDFWATSVSWSTSGTLTMSCDVESSSPLVRTYRKQGYGMNSINPIDVENIVTGMLDQSLTDLTSINVFDDIKTRFDNIDTDVGTINTNIGTINNSIGTLNTDISNINGDISDINTDIGNLNTDIGNINTDIGGLNTDVGNLQTSVGSLNTSVGGLDTRVTTLEQGTSVGQWIIQVNGVAQTTGTINFVT